MKAISARGLRRRLLLAFGLIASVCLLAITFYVFQARQHVGADYTAMVADVVRAQQDPDKLRTALDRHVDLEDPHHGGELAKLLQRLPRRIEGIRLQLMRSDLPLAGYTPLLEELADIEERIEALRTQVTTAEGDEFDSRALEEVRTRGLEIEEGLAWNYSELSQLLHQASADQRRLMGWLTLAVVWLLMMVVLAVGTVMLMLVRLQRQQDTMRHLSHTDELTGLFNRRRLQEVAEQEFARRRRHASPLSLMLLDLDHFKRINDTYGHPVGDEVLSAFSDILLHQVRRLDTVARMGGEEFAVLLPNTDGEAAHRLAERVREATRAMRLPGRAHAHRLTVSIGVTEAREDDSFEHLYSRADQRLYRAKAAGRDRVESGDAKTYPIDGGPGKMPSTASGA
ncbi:hypothetical protein BOX17_11725 [Halomonas aestuarii]|uniref:diguanylate cyclase n=1 Tax=Halomonas aestuarii TaxID=1897729 RepID=A0A1J0VHP0_9GAMM|nr:GGDEF domain-containing protein [Halomonas aestuarii]APE31556.1 hypothetical protein BOX17_11725 [Halomonas aestuarii]